MTPVPANAVSAEDLFATATQAGYRAHVRWQGDGSHGKLEAVFLPGENPAIPSWNGLPGGTTKTSLRTNASYRDTLDKTKDHISSVLRQHLAQNLPDY